MKNFLFSVYAAVLTEPFCSGTGHVQRVRLDADKITYRVYITSTTSYTGNPARISTAQATLVVPHGTGEPICLRYRIR